MVYEPSMGSAVYVLLNTHGPHDFRFQIKLICVDSSLLIVSI